MEDEEISYVYNYDPINEVFLIRRNDGKSLEGFIPDGLIQQAILSYAFSTGEMVIICDMAKTKHFSADGTKAFFDLKSRKFSKEDVRRILGEEETITFDDSSKTKVDEESPKGLRKILSRFKRK